jgi:hypothetical protein
VQIDTHQITSVQRTGDANQYVREIGEDTPVMRFVRIGQSRTRYFATKSHMIWDHPADWPRQEECHHDD